jgi:uncharacterized membrane protein
MWNLYLAWVALGLAVILTRKIAFQPAKWVRFMLGILWLVFLPNTFYIITDLIHIRTTPGDFAWFDLVMLISFAFTGIVLGFTGLRLIHERFIRLYGQIGAQWLISAIIVLASFGVYIGRFLRLNSWDVFKSPGDAFISTLSGLSASGEPAWAFAFCLIFATLLLCIYWAVFAPAIEE